MTLILRIENFDSLENGGPLTFTVEGRGASIGRRNANDWVLPDPERHISGTHFEVTFDGAQYYLVDVSTNGTFLQGQSYRLDGPHPIANGDRFTVGHYVIAASLPVPAAQPAAAPQQPVAPPSPFVAQPTQAPAAPVVPPQPVAPAAPVEDDWDWGDLGGSTPEPSAPQQPSGLQQPPTTQAPTPQPGAAPRPTTQLPPTFAQPSNPPGGGQVRMPPTTQAPAAPVTQMPPTSNPPEPQITAFGAPPADPQPDIQTGLGGQVPPSGAPAPAQAAPAAPPAAPPSDLPMPTPRPPMASPAPIPSAEPAPMPLPSRAPAPAEAPAATGDGTEAFLAAFCEAAGVDPAAYPDLDAATLGRQLGSVVRVSADEIIAMLHERAAVKHFTRGGERTERSATGNNPMKFMPDAEQALEAMFLKKRQGFMEGPDAFANALGDVRQHQKAVFAALQPALAHVLAGLSPDEVMETSGGGLLSGGGRSKAWEKYVELWDAKAALGENGMLDVFLQAFAETYARAIGGRD